MKKSIIFSTCLITTLFTFFQQSCRACTSFCLDKGDELLFGNNLDWHVGDGLVIINKRSVRKTAMWYDNPACWISKYGSITVNQWGREFPSRGMNEAGLVVGEMTLKETRYPSRDSRRAIPMLQWIQYQLDNHSTIDEVIASDSIIRIHPNEYTSHFLVCDRSGNCVSMEWLNGKLVYHAYETMPIEVLVNSTYASCIARGNDPSGRFLTVSEMLDHYDPNTSGSAVDYVFDILKKVGSGSWTKWSLVFDIRSLRFYFRTNSNQEIRYVDLKCFDFSCDNPVKILDINVPLSGNIRGYFTDYTEEMNRSVIVNTANILAPHFGQTPQWVIDRMSRYPESTVCLGSYGGQEIPEKTAILQNYPNPFRSSMTIHFRLTKSQNVTLKVYNLLGEEIKTLTTGKQRSGEHTVTWIPKNLPSGVYVCRFEAGNFSETRKLILVH